MNQLAQAATQQLWAEYALLPGGWAHNVLLSWDAVGDLLSVHTDPDIGSVPIDSAVKRVKYVIPGMVNVHSHAFQRAMAGLAENAEPNQTDNFWRWRQQMYQLAAHINPAQLQAIAAQLYSECLRFGYTSVCEFHYLHRAPNGQFYAKKTAMADALVQAAKQTGIGMSLLPVLYSYADFNQQTLSAQQQRFATSVDDVLVLLQILEAERSAQLSFGVAPHSLRAASLPQIKQLLDRLPPNSPVHLHIAEQQKEVADCLAATGQRPVAYLLNQLAANAYLDSPALPWCLVHATHLSAEECLALAQTQAVVGLCPSTEGNLGDGLFMLDAFVRSGGRFAIGSDSHVCVNPFEELRWLEYGQRLFHQRRHVAHSAHSAALQVGGVVSSTVVDANQGQANSAGEFLWQAAAGGGARASGRRVGQLAAGYRADFLVLDEQHPNLQVLTPQQIMNHLIFASNENLIRDVVVGGQTVVSHGRHHQQDQIAAEFVACLRQLRATPA